MALTAWLSKPDAGSASSDQLTAYRTLGAAKTNNITGLSQPRSGALVRAAKNANTAPSPVPMIVVLTAYAAEFCKAR